MKLIHLGDKTEPVEQLILEICNYRTDVMKYNVSLLKLAG